MNAARKPSRSATHAGGEGIDRCDGANAVLVVTLSLAVPLRIHQLLTTSPDRDGLQRMWASRAATEVGSHGDDLMFGSKRNGATADVFNRLAEGLAALALCPGGVLFAGLHWCAEHRGGAPTSTELTCIDRGVHLHEGQLMEVLHSSLLNNPPQPSQEVA